MDISRVARKHREETLKSIEQIPLLDPKSLEEQHADRKRCHEKSLRASRALARKMRQDAEDAKRLLTSSFIVVVAISPGSGDAGGAPPEGQRENYKT